MKATRRVGSKRLAASTRPGHAVGHQFVQFEVGADVAAHASGQGSHVSDVVFDQLCAFGLAECDLGCCQFGVNSGLVCVFLAPPGVARVERW